MDGDARSGFVPLDPSDELLTAPRGALGAHCSEEARKHIALYASGRLFITRNAYDHPEISGILRLARAKGIAMWVPSVVDPGTIRGLYHESRRNVETAEPDGNAAQVVDEKMRAHVFHVLADGVRRRGVSDILVKYDREESRVFALVDGHQESLIDGVWDPAYGKQFLRAALAWAGMEGSGERGYTDGAHQVGQISSGLPPGLESVRLQKLATGFDGEELILRLMPSSIDERIELSSIGFADEEILKLDEMISIASGIVIVTGPTGAGKTTTLHGMLSRSLDTFPGDRWITVEDPIEIRLRHPNVSQVDAVRTAIDDNTSLAYQRALEAALRAAPKRLLFGEIRSAETARIAVTAALTGHPVLTTLHTDGCMKVVARLVDLGLSPSLLVNQGVLRGVSSQRLLRVLCECSVPITAREWQGYCPPWLTELFREHGCVRTANHAGCMKCRSGYRVGRQVIAEIMPLDQRLTHLLVTGDSQEAMDYWRSMGGVPMLDTARKHVAAGLFDPYEVFRCLNF